LSDFFSSVLGREKQLLVEFFNRETAPACGRRRRPPGDDLLSHTVPRAVPSALKGLTAVFGKGTGVAPSLWSPDLVRLWI
jgi:hypothetical protein